MAGQMAPALPGEAAPADRRWELATTEHHRNDTTAVAPRTASQAGSVPGRLSGRSIGELSATGGALASEERSMSARMLDQLRRGEWGMPTRWQEGQQAISSRIPEWIAEAVAVDATPVEEALAEDEWNTKHYEWERFPSLRPPFDVMWAEVTRGQSSLTQGTRWGALYLTVDNGRDAALGDRSVVSLMFTSVYPTSTPIGPDALLQYDLDAAGQLDGTPKLMEFVVDEQNNYASSEQVIQAMRRKWAALNLAIAFMHCKNVTLADEHRSRADWRRIQRDGVEPVRFKTLDIGPMRRVLETEGQSATVGLQRALHICRGHFSTYSPERPLFGKHAGTFWVPAHVRGTADAGVVAKDYRVLPA